MYKETATIRLKKIREEIGLTQYKVAEETGIDRTKLSKVENGKREPNIEELGQLACYYNVTSDWLLGITKKEKST